MAHEEQRDIALCGDLARNLHTAMDSHATFKGNVSGVLDGCAVGQRVTERHTKFDDVGSSLGRCGAGSVRFR